MSLSDLKQAFPVQLQAFAPDPAKYSLPEEKTTEEQSAPFLREELPKNQDQSTDDMDIDPNAPSDSTKKKQFFPPLPLSTLPTPEPPIHPGIPMKPKWAQKLIRKVEDLERQQQIQQAQLEDQECRDDITMHKLEQNTSDRHSGEGKGGVAGGNPTMRWQGITKNALLEGEVLPSVYPVMLGGTGNDGRKNSSYWAPFPWEVVKEARKSLKEHGLQSPYTQAFIDNIFTT